MADRILVEFSGGPCNGQHTFVTADRIRAGGISCGGTYYVFANSPGPNTYTAVPAKALEAPTAVSGSSAGKQFDIAWTRLMRTLAQTVPATDKARLRASARIRKAVR